MRIYSKTDKGAVRLSNQDAFAAGELKNGMVWAVVCDGMGGASGGEVAGTTAVKSISDSILASYQPSVSESGIRAILATAVDNANLSVFDIANNNPALKGMGTTVVSIIVDKQKLHIMHAGDSRAYLIRDSKAIQLTRDHSVVQNMLENGEITAEEAINHPDKHVITRALGVNDSIQPEYDCFDLLEDDVILICTDGLSNYITGDRLVELITSNSLSTVPELLVKEAMENGSTDNITAVILS